MRAKRRGQGGWWGVVVAAVGLLLAGASGGCDDSAQTQPEGRGTDALDDVGDVTGGPVAAPQGCPSGELEGTVCAPARPQLVDWACPEGWRPVSAGIQSAYVDDVDVCSPPDAPPSAPCPAGDWDDEATLRARAEGFGGRVWFVKPQAAAGGDGSQAQPLATLQAAVDAAQAGDIIALSRGDFPEAVEVTRPVALLGACTSQTRLTSRPRQDGSADILILRGGGALVRDLSLAPTPDALRYGLTILADAPAAPVTVLSVEVVKAIGGGVGIAGPLTVTLRDVWVRDVVGSSGGVLAVRGAQVDAERLVVLNTRGMGANVSGEGSALTVRDGYIANTQSAAPALQPAPFHLFMGVGAAVSEGGTLALERVTLLRNQSAGVLAHGATKSPPQPVQLDLTDVAVFDSQPRPADQGGGEGLLAIGATVTARRVVLARNHFSGVRVRAVEGAETTISAQDAVIAQTRSRARDRDYGTGWLMGDGARAEVERAVVEGNRAAGAVAYGDGTALTLRDVVLAGTQAAEAPQVDGFGAAVVEGAALVTTRALLSENHDVGLYLLQSEATLEDVAILETQPRPLDGDFGAGIAALDAPFDATRLLVARNHFNGLALIGAGTRATLRSLRVTDTRPAPCRDGVCDDGIPGGVGLVIGGAQAEITGFEVSASASVGVQIYDLPDDAGALPPSVSARDGWITTNKIGLNVQSPTIQLIQSFTNVRLFANDLDQDLSELPLPKLRDLLDAFNPGD